MNDTLIRKKIHRKPHAQAGSRGAMWVPIVGLVAGVAAVAVSAMSSKNDRGVSNDPTSALASIAADPTELATGAPPQAATPIPGRLVELPLRLDHIDVLAVRAHGFPVPDFDSRSSCNAAASLTDANFNGGSFLVEAGFAEGEIFAATYTLPASDFPIKINLAEAIFATAGATQQTTTQWSVLFWQGVPAGGTLVDSFSSDGSTLPNIVMGPGTNGVNVQFSIDVSDTDQIVIADNGSHQFSVGWRIDKHNSQTSNPCLTPPPVCCNAFPVADVSGLAFPASNWLFGLNCGSTGCPPNGGWARFSALASGCRPTGDIVQRVTWSSVACQVGVGPCCLTDGTCAVKSVNDCVALGGTYQGDGTSCAGVTCPVTRGACCFSSGFCINNLSQVDCSGAGGVWLGSGSACNGTSCPTGACCLPSGACIDGVTAAQCSAQSGTFRGVGTACATTDCPKPTGACCTGTGFCLILKESDCLGIGGASWAGPFTTCADDNHDGRADICKCPADFDGNGFVTGDDYDAFVNAFEVGSTAADFNRDGFVTGDDFDGYVDHFAGGC